MDTLTKYWRKPNWMFDSGEGSLETNPSSVIKALQEALLDLGIEWALPSKLPPSEVSDVEAWREGVDAVDSLHDWLEAIESAGDVRAEALRQETLEGQLKALPDEPTSMPDRGAPAELHYALYQQALAVRDDWARLHSAPIRALHRCIDAAMDRRSLRRLLDDEEDTRLWIRRLFPVFGSTLLSLGNVFTPDSFRFEQLIIDEGGQCHPAYAVSGLMRCQRALIIGDVNRLGSHSAE